MRYAAYQSRRDGTDFSFQERDEAAGVLGRLTPGTAPAVATAETLHELKREARAYLGVEPAALLYLVDEDGRVHQVMINEPHHAATERAERWAAVSISLLVFCVTCLTATAFGSPGGWALVGFAGASALYALLLRAGFFNEIEGAVACELLLILVLCRIPEVRRVPRAAAEPAAASDRIRLARQAGRSSLKNQGGQRFTMNPWDFNQ